MINLNDLKNEIINCPQTEPVFLYIGVGAAATNKEHLSLANYQQFPPFLQEMHNKVPNLHLFLLLIDPYHESPPYVATDYNLQEYSETHYKNDLIQVFVYRQSVYTDVDLDADSINITPMLSDLNQFSKERDISLLYHDFTGRSTALLAEHFDRENKDYLDQIIYGMSAREDHGCFFDLTQPTAYFPYKLDYQENRRPLIKMFNYYYYILSKRYDESEEGLQTYPEDMRQLALVQKEQIIGILRTNFKNINLSVLRQVRKVQLDQAVDEVDAHNDIAQAANADYSKYLFRDLPKFYREMFIELYKEKDYDLLCELMFNYTASELNILAQLKCMDMSGEELLTFITLDEDPYKWFNDMNGLI